MRLGDNAEATLDQLPSIGIVEDFLNGERRADSAEQAVKRAKRCERGVYLCLHPLARRGDAIELLFGLSTGRGEAI